MELYQQIISKLREEKTPMSLDAETVAAMVEGVCYQALVQIRNILDNAELEDEECFWNIEEIVCVLEEIGSDGGCRHDFS